MLIEFLNASLLLEILCLSLMCWLVILLPVGILLATCCPIFCNPEKISHDIATAATCNPLLGMSVAECHVKKKVMSHLVLRLTTLPVLMLT